MTDFTVAIADLRNDAARFHELSDRFSTFGTVMGAVSAAAVDDWGFWESYKAAVDSAMSATAAQATHGAQQLATTGTVLDAVATTYAQEELDNTHLTTHIY
jgi:sugar (pentulose or hexulose) kinase